MSTIGAGFAEGAAGAVAGADAGGEATGAAAAGTAAWVTCVVVVFVAVLVDTGATVLVAVLTVRLGAARAAAVEELLSVTGEVAVSVAGAGLSSEGAGWALTDGAGSVVVGCACCASSEVEESARAAAIAVEAPVRA